MLVSAAGTPIPPIDFATAQASGRRVTPAGPRLSGPEMAEIVAGLQAAAEASVGPVAEVTRLGADAPGPMLVVDRANWVDANCAMVSRLLAEAGGGVGPRPAGLTGRLEAHANGVQLGGAMAFLATRVLGQYLPFAAEPALLIVAPNVAAVERALGVDRPDFRLWVCLHEQTHRLQFARAPWLRDYLVRATGQLLSAPQTFAPQTLLRGGSLVDAVTSPEQRGTFDRISGVMALLEGYADVMMDRVGPDVVPTVAEIRRRFERRRSRGGLYAALNRLIGMDLKLAQYRDGAAFCTAVIGRVGVDGLNAVYEGPGLLPSLEEIHDPQRWVARVHG